MMFGGIVIGLLAAFIVAVISCMLFVEYQERKGRRS